MIATQDTLSHPRQESRTTNSGLVEHDGLVFGFGWHLDESGS